MTDNEMTTMPVGSSKPAPTSLYGGAAVLKAIELYLKTGMRVNRAYTPARMIGAAALYTGRPVFGRGKTGLKDAAGKLRAWLFDNGWPVS